MTRLVSMSSSSLLRVTSARVAAVVASVGLLLAMLAPAAQAVGPVDTFFVGSNPTRVAISADGATAYVTNTGTTGSPGNTVAIYEIATGTSISTVFVGTGPESIVLNPAGTKLYVANRTSGTVSVISTATNLVINTISVGVGATDIAFSPDGSRAYVSRYNASGLTDVIDTATETALTPISGTPVWSRGVAVSPDGQILYVTGSNADQLFLVDLSTNTVSAGISVGDFPTRLAVSADGATVYVVNNTTFGTVSVFDTASATVVDTINLGGFPDDIVLSPDGTRAYVPNLSNDTVSVIDLATNVEFTQVFAGNEPRGIAISPDGRTLITADYGGASATKLGFEVSRIAGAGRYETAVAISQETYPSPAAVPFVFIATGANYPDALAVGPVAASKQGPLLLTARDSLPSVVAAEISRLNPAKIVIVGGVGAVSSAVESQLAALQPDVTRLQGGDRYATGRAVVEFGYPSAGEVWIATGRNFPDALSAGAAGAGTGYPVLLVDGSAATLDSATLDTLTTLAPLRIKIAGGTSAVSTGIADELALTFPGATIERFSGVNRYETSAAIIADAYPLADRVLLATGASFPDALAGTPMSGRIGAPLLVVPPTCFPPASSFYELERLGAGQITLLGGSAALGAGVFDLTTC
jgi:YVTN family beta-propeller protein